MVALSGNPPIKIRLVAWMTARLQGMAAAIAMPMLVSLRPAHRAHALMSDRWVLTPMPSGPWCMDCCRN